MRARECITPCLVATGVWIASWDKKGVSVHLEKCEISPTGTVRLNAKTYEFTTYDIYTHSTRRFLNI